MNLYLLIYQYDGWTNRQEYLPAPLAASVSPSFARAEDVAHASPAGRIVRLPAVRKTRGAARGNELKYCL